MSFSILEGLEGVEGLERTERDLLLQAAELAPAVRDIRPWRFRVHEGAIEVYADPDGPTPTDDAQRRAYLMSAGAAVFNLRVAAGYLGGVTCVSRFPDLDQPLLVAEVIPSAANDLADAEQAARLAGLYRLVAGPSPTPLLPNLPFGYQDELTEVARSEGAALEWVVEPYRSRWLRDLAALAALLDGGRPRTSQMSGGRANGTHRLAVLSTRRDGPEDWLAAGQALQHLLLTARSYGLAVSLLNDAVDQPRLRWLVRDPTGGIAAPQAILQFGS